MRAIQQRHWGGPEVMELVDTAEPEPQFTEVLVRVVAAGVNPVDAYTRRGDAYNRVLALPFINGWDVAGVVEQVGYGVTRFRPGDRVFGMLHFPRAAGAYAEYVTAPSRQFARIPDGIDFIHAAALPLAALSAWQMLVEVGAVRAGHRVLVSAAAGGVGHLAVQIAKSFGAYVIGTAQRSKHEFVRAQGADEVIDYTTTDVPATVRDIDIVIQMFGGEPALRTLETLVPGGILVNSQAAWTPGMHKRATQLGVRASGFLVEPDRANLEAIADLAAKHELAAHIETVFPLERAADAHRSIELHRTTGKIVLTVTDA
ncbi:NADP-dependent oxidoreductase [Nocardia abscessus]|uniref:NADP-dependent oxidoreductase n=1 Tax=Nocardia abscessus TaxID=120957 RepID=UPI0018953A63|nr:NADP-dependent oxidoreductase [Nocardia abscessus]MBF6341674.1 NADP-dependent oxidoreductase [Nocardia abscessus]